MSKDPARAPSKLEIVEPIGDRVLIRKDEDRKTTKTGIHLPDKIEIYSVPLEAEFGHDPELLEEEIRITVVHEVAHHFGIDEERLAELGWD